MKKQYFTLMIVALTILLAGCAGHAGEQALRPIDAAAWPAPAAAQPTVPPTPFPKINLEDVCTATPAPPVTAANIEPAGLSVAAAPEEPAADSTPTAPVGLPDMSALTPLIDGQVNTSAVNLRQGPGPDYAKVGILELGRVVDVLAINPAGDWVLIKSSKLTGWVYLDYLDLLAPADNLPVVMPAATTG
ncbi:MAG: hypothetical protein FOGNACKC_04370 [Anaerolineae bacterium]|nr:hypothetical protein [Anaerolineae bacterium]